jgi:hypothetical protein
LNSYTTGGSQLQGVSGLLNIRAPVCPKALVAVKSALVAKFVMLGDTGSMGLRIDFTAAALVPLAAFLHKVPRLI